MTDSGLLVPPLTPIDLESIPWEALTDEGEPTGVELKWLVDPSIGKNCMLVRFPPNHRAAPHWHSSDTVYLVRRGEFLIEGEGSYPAGTARWVRGGYAYGAEVSGPNGCEFYFFSLGPYGRFDPDEHPAPLGRWDADQNGMTS